MANTYITKTPSSTTNQRTWTVSCWVKRSLITSTQMIWGVNGDSSGNYFTELNFNSGDQLEFRQGGTVGDPYQTQMLTNARYRDTNGWYHIVVAADTTQGTEANRLKIYVNGEQITSFAISNYPSQNEQFRWHYTGYAHSIGRSGQDNARYFNGSISHFHNIDGTQYQASDFGETDSTTGEWKIKTAPSLTYGSFGTFILKDGNSVTDQSGRGNNWTVGGGTLTKTEDCPSNVFATINPLWKHNVSSQNNVVLVQGNTTWYPSSATNNHSWGRSTLGWTSGKYYFEFKIEEVNTGQASGVWMVPVEYPSNSSPQSGSNINYGWQVQYSSSDANFYTTNGGSSVSTITSSLGANPIIMMAIDADNKKMWVGHNGTWWNNNNASTTLNNSYPDHTWTIGTYGDMYQLAFQAYYSSSNYNNARANFGNGYFGTTAVSSAGTNASNNGIFEYDVPSGFTALSTKGLNL
mgnify:CR=1 FL=1